MQVKLLIFLFVNYRVSQLGSGHVFTILLGYNSMVEAGPLQLTLSGARNEPSRRKPLLGLGLLLVAVSYLRYYAKHGK